MDSTIGIVGTGQTVRTGIVGTKRTAGTRTVGNGHTTRTAGWKRSATDADDGTGRELAVGNNTSTRFLVPVPPRSVPTTVSRRLLFARTLRISKLAGFQLFVLLIIFNSAGVVPNTSYHTSAYLDSVNYILPHSGRE